MSIQKKIKEGASWLHYNGYAHTLACLVVVTIFAIFSLTWIGYIAVVSFFLGREFRDYQIKKRLPLVEFWKGWEFWNWPWDDFLIPVLVSGVWAGILAASFG